MSNVVAVPKPRKRRKLLWRVLLGLVLLLLAGGAFLYHQFGWVFFVKPGPGGEALELPVHVVAGNGEAGFQDGRGDAVRMHKPIRLAPWGDDGVVFADINNHAIRVAYIDGRVETLAGGPDRQGHEDGEASVARFDSPHGVAVRADGAIAVCEASGNTIRLIEKQDGGWVVTTLAGSPSEKGMRDGKAEEALFDAPHAVAFGAEGQLYVADIGNHRIREIRDGQVTTVAGSDERGDADGPLGTGTLAWPMDIAVDSAGGIWIADAGEAKVRLWTPAEGLTTPFALPDLAMPHGIAVVPGGHVAVAEMYGHRILRLTPGTDLLATYCGTTEEGMAEGQLRKPAAVLAHAGRLWIADLGNHRIVTVPLPE